MKHLIFFLFLNFAFLPLAGSLAGEKDVLISDRNFPLVQLPAEFDSHRATKRFDLKPGETMSIFDGKGPGAVRHFWLTSTSGERLGIEITCDGATQPQVKMSLHQFFGVLLGQKPYRIESAPIKLLPRNGYNSYFPIPFQKSCKIVIRNISKNNVAVWSMVNWQKYDAAVKVTPLRLHVLFSEEKPAGALGSSLLGAIEGKGFVAGMFHAIRRKDRRDMIWHTGGDTWLIDGETNPHLIRGIGSEDVFGYSFGVYKDLSEWVGGVHAVGENADCSEIVAYRFFGVDPIAFKSSLVLRFGTRANDIENLLYFYKEAGSTTPKVATPQTWELTGPVKLPKADAFASLEEPTWDAKKIVKATSEHTWVDFVRYFRASGKGNTGTQPTECAAYARTTINSPEARQAELQLGFDDQMKVWLNGELVTTLNHDAGAEVVKVPVKLKKGANSLVIALSNFNNIEWRAWAFSCVVGEK